MQTAALMGLGKCFCAPLCTGAAHARVPVSWGSALSPAPMTDCCHHHFIQLSAAVQSNSELQAAFCSCCVAPDLCTEMQIETASGPLCADSSASPKIGFVHSLGLDRVFSVMSSCMGSAGWAGYHGSFWTQCPPGVKSRTHYICTSVKFRQGAASISMFSLVVCAHLPAMLQSRRAFNFS